jgi:splicing factor U2AF subunit
MADYLASIFGTEKDKVNCSFYFKIGACRHGEKCSKVHNKPTYSQTVLLKNLYLNPLNSSQTADRSVFENLTEDELQRHFDDIFEELFVEIELKYGEIEEMNICDNLSEHLAGNTYVKFVKEDDANKACTNLNNRWFNRKPIYAELSPVTDFHEACCRQYQMGECPRGGFCNFMHLKPISNRLRRKLFSVKRAAAATTTTQKSPSPPTMQSHHNAMHANPYHLQGQYMMPPVHHGVYQHGGGGGGGNYGAHMSHHHQHPVDYDYYGRDYYDGDYMNDDEYDMMYQQRSVSKSPSPPPRQMSKASSSSKKHRKSSRHH